MFKLAIYMLMNKPTPSIPPVGVSFLTNCFTPALFHSKNAILH